MIQSTRGQAQGVERLYLDFDSFFASAEQHFNADLRGRPLGVVPLDSPHTGCIAVSRQAKALGVKSGTTVKQAREIIPDMIFVVARHDVYVRLHKRILEVIDTVVPVSKVRSIDEVVCNLLPHEAREGAALSQRMKSALAEAFSDTLSCSIGMAPTELLAKIGAELNKPDGFVLIEADDLPARLEHIDLDDLPGISKGMRARLTAAHVNDFKSLWELAPKQARAIWGSVEGERFWNGLHGYHIERPETKKSMFGHSRMLPHDWRAPDKIRACSRLLTTSAARRLRRADVRATKLSLSLRGGGYRRQDGSRSKDLSWSWETTFAPARDDHTFLQAVSEGLAKSERAMKFRPKSVSVVIHGLIAEQDRIADLFGETKDPSGRGADTASRAKWEKVSDLLDTLRQSHGPKAMSLGPQDNILGGYLGAKIAFGRIPDEHDFSEAPVADEDTHFLSY
mgnify:CR=1 FL=1